MAGYLNGANAKSFVAESLVSNTSMTGSTLKYKLNTLTYAGKGKGGMDGALAYEWNKLTGSKVWVANFAAGSTSIAQWAPGGKIYNAVLPALMAVAQVARAEENAGHFNVLYRIGLWQQGENDSRHGVSESAYLNQFTRMYQSLDSKLNLDKFGIIPTRACQGNNKTSGELNMDGPRAAQYAIAQDNTTFKDVFIVSNVNESWTSDSGVKNYFKSFYPSGKLTYPLRSNTSISRSNLPDSVRDVHPSIHYSQLGYNQNGITAALGMYDVVKGKVNKSSLTVSGYFRGKSGTKITGVTGSAGGTARVFFMTGKPQALKRIVYKGTNVTYDKKTGTVKFTAAKNGRLSAVDSVTGKTLATITVKFNGGWISSGGKTYFYNSATSKITGLVKINGYRYYFDKNGVRNTAKEAERNPAAAAKTDVNALTLKNGVKTKGDQVAAYALKYVGNPYVYGGCSLTKGTDCSGFVMLIYKHFGVNLPHYDAAIRSHGKEVSSLKEAKAGDIVCYYGHVAIYLGDGRIVHASNSRDGIKISERADYRTIACIRRIFN
jgi:cell wall-associated NlpC family hydrolase